MSILKRTFLFTVLFVIAITAVAFVMKRNLEFVDLVILAVVYFVLNYVLGSVMEHVAKDHKKE